MSHWIRDPSVLAPTSEAWPEGPEIIDRGLTFHHVGVACRDIERETRPLLELGYRREGPDFTDPVQGVRGRFLAGQSPRLELLAPLDAGAGGVLDPWLRAKTKFYHLAYETSGLDEAIARMTAGGLKLVADPVAAIAFEHRRIAFLVLPTLVLIELIERR